MECYAFVIGRSSDRRPWRHPSDAVPVGATRDQQDDTCTGGRRAVPPAAVCRRHLPPQPGKPHTETQTARRHRPPTRVRYQLGCYGTSLQGAPKTQDCFRESRTLQWLGVKAYDMSKSENLGKIHCHCQIQHNFKRIEYFCKLCKEYLISLTS